MSRFLRGAVFVVRETWRAAPTKTGGTIALSLLLALTPGLQVVAIAALIRSLEHARNVGDVAGPLVAVIVIVGLTGPARSTANALRIEVDHHLIASVITKLMSTAARTPPSRLARAETTTEIEAHYQATMGTVQRLFGQTVGGVENVIGALGVVVAVFSFSPVAGILTSLAILPALAAGRFLTSHSAQLNDALGEIFSRERYLANTLLRQRSATELAALGTSERIADGIAEQWRMAITARTRMLRTDLRSDWIVGLISTALVFGALSAIVVGTRFGPVAAAGVSGIIAASAAVAAAGSQISDVIRNAPFAADIEDFLDSVPPQRSLPDPRPAKKLEVIGLSHTYGDDDSPAIRGINISASAGEVIALVGANGAGKTTTVNSIVGLLQCRAGRVTVDGQTIDDLGEAQWSSEFALMTQEFGRYEFSVRDTVLLGTGRTGVTDEEVWAALRGAHLDGLVRSMPAGLGTQLGEQWGGVGLSGGQWQRLALARIFLRDSPIWILDEPTSAIDAGAEQEIFAELYRTKADRITLIVSHRAWTLRGMDKIYVFDAGQIVEIGTFDQLLEMEGRFATLFQEQVANA